MACDRPIARSVTYNECPYAGGAGLAINLLSKGFVKSISLNDIDESIYALWWSILNETKKFCSKIEKTPITVDEWHKQKKVWSKNNVSNPVALGFAAYFLNRTNRSGIIDGAGPIGGFDQKGHWKIDARFNKKQQISNIQMIAQYKDKIDISNTDALKFITKKIKKEDTFLYLDPPYYIKGQKLYKNFYIPEDHEVIAQMLRRERKSKWVVSYDDVPEIRKMYKTFKPRSYNLNYSAGQKGIGKEVMFVSDALHPPSLTKLKRRA